LFEVQTRDFNRATTAYRAVRFRKILPCASCAAWLLKVLSSAVYRVDVHLIMNLCKTKRLLEVFVLDDNSCFSCLSCAFYLRFSDVSGRRLVGKILLLVSCRWRAAVTSLMHWHANCLSTTLDSYLAGI